MNSTEFRNVRMPADIIHRDRFSPRTMIEHDLANPDNIVQNAPANSGGTFDEASTHEQNMDNLPYVIPEAFLAEKREDNVMMGCAEPLLPLRKQIRTNFCWYLYSLFL